MYAFSMALVFGVIANMQDAPFWQQVLAAAVAALVGAAMGHLVVRWYKHRSAS